MFLVFELVHIKVLLWRGVFTIQTAMEFSFHHREVFWDYLFIYFSSHLSYPELAGEGGEEMERRAARAEEEDDGGEAAPCGVQARAAAAGHCEKGTGRGGKGEDVAGLFGVA